MTDLNVSSYISPDPVTPHPLGDGREEMSTVEHADVPLPYGIIRSDGSLDLYEDVHSRFTIDYKQRSRRLVIRGGRWVGRIPLNGRYALRVETRVPVSNLERVICRSSSAKIDLLDRYSHIYGQTDDRPQSLFDVLADRFLLSLDLIWNEGLLKTYVRGQFRSSRPFGRLDPYRTVVTMRTKGQAIAHFAAFCRTTDCGPNRVIKSAVSRLLAVYRGYGSEGSQISRIRRIQSAARHLEGVRLASCFELNPASIEEYIRRLPDHHSSYADALRIAGSISGGFGIALRDPAGFMNLPVILIDMAEIFENYVRATLGNSVELFPSGRVLNGNLSGSGGAKSPLFRRMDISGTNPSATPDIVITRGREALAIIDVKYKPAKEVPDRSEINQIVCYAATYDCKRVMIVYPDLPKSGEAFQSLGMVGSIQVYRASLDIGALELELEERRFAQSVFSEL